MKTTIVSVLLYWVVLLLAISWAVPPWFVFLVVLLGTFFLGAVARDTGRATANDANALEDVTVVDKPSCDPAATTPEESEHNNSQSPTASEEGESFARATVSNSDATSATPECTQRPPSRRAFTHELVSRGAGAVRAPSTARTDPRTVRKSSEEAPCSKVQKAANGDQGQALRSDGAFGQVERLSFPVPTYDSTDQRTKVQAVGVAESLKISTNDCSTLPIEQREVKAESDMAAVGEADDTVKDQCDARDRRNRCPRQENSTSGDQGQPPASVAASEHGRHPLPPVSDDAPKASDNDSQSNCHDGAIALQSSSRTARTERKVWSTMSPPPASTEVVDVSEFFKTSTNKCNPQPVEQSGVKTRSEMVAAGEADVIVKDQSEARDHRGPCPEEDNARAAASGHDQCPVSPVIDDAPKARDNDSQTHGEDGAIAPQPSSSDLKTGREVLSTMSPPTAASGIKRERSESHGSQSGDQDWGTAVPRNSGEETTSVAIPKRTLASERSLTEEATEEDVVIVTDQNDTQANDETRSSPSNEKSSYPEPGKTTSGDHGESSGTDVGKSEQVAPSSPVSVDDPSETLENNSGTADEASASRPDEGTVWGTMLPSTEARGSKREREGSTPDDGGKLRGIMMPTKREEGVSVVTPEQVSWHSSPEEEEKVPQRRLRKEKSAKRKRIERELAKLKADQKEHSIQVVPKRLELDDNISGRPIKRAKRELAGLAEGEDSKPATMQPRRITRANTFSRTRKRGTKRSR